MKNPQNQEIPKRITCIDSGEWSNAQGLSQPRMYTPIRELEANGVLRIESMEYVQSPILGEPFPEESEGIYEHRHNRRRAVERDRVRLTCTNYRIKAFRDFDLDAKEPLSPIVCVNMRPGGDQSSHQSSHRNTLLENLIQRDSVKRILLAPPYFSSLEELDDVQQMDAAEKIALWTPYRYAVGIRYTKELIDQREIAIAAGTITVVCGSFPARRLLREFALPFLDAFLSITGGVTDHAVKLSDPNGLPIFSIAAQHGSLISSMLFSTAGSGFQNLDHARIRFLNLDMTNIDLINTLCSYIHQTPTEHISGGSPSHDPPRSTLNGARFLVNACLSSEPKTDLLPTVRSFKRTQEFIDALLDELQRTREGENERV